MIMIADQCGIIIIIDTDISEEDLAQMDFIDMDDNSDLDSVLVQTQGLALDPVLVSEEMGCRILVPIF